MKVNVANQLDDCLDYCGALSKFNVIKTFVMKNVLITIFFILSFAPMFAQTVPEKEIDFEGSFIMDDARSASLPIEAYLQDTQVVITFYVDLSDATVTIASEENNQEMEERTISFIDSAPEVFNISGYSKGTYIITITTPRGTYLSGLFRIE